MAPREVVDILSQEMQKPLLSGDIPGSARTEHINYFNNIVHAYLNEMMVGDWIYTIEFKGVYFKAFVVPRPKMFL